MLPRFYVDESLPLTSGLSVTLPDGAARHVQVLRMQPGDQVQLFDGAGHEWLAAVTEMGRKSVSVEVGASIANDRELPVRVTLAMGMPANDRMDALVEKASELGVHAIQPLLCARSVLRLDGERAAKKVAHWQAVAVAACEQSGRAVVPQIYPIAGLGPWLQAQAARGVTGDGEQAATTAQRGVLSLRQAVSVRQWLEGVDAAQAGAPAKEWLFLSGPEGGLAPEEETLALSLGWSAVSLGARVLRADTAPLAVLSVIGARYEA